MSDIKNYGIKGVSNDVQIGKSGPRIKESTGKLTMRDTADTGYINVEGADPVDAQDFVTKTYFEANAGSASDKIQLPADTVHGGAINDWVVDTTTYSTALDDLNEIMGLLVPEQPGTWPEADDITDVSSDVTWQMASGAVPDNTTDGLPTAGTNVKTTFAASSTTDVVGLTGDLGSGSGTDGTITALLNNGDIGNTALTSGDDSGTFTSLVITANADFPAATPGFFRVLQARISGATALGGYNKVQITHSAANDSSEYYWIYDSVIAGAGTVTGGAVADPGLTTSNSSTVPHFDNAQNLNVSGTLNNVSGYVYRKSQALTIQATTLSGNGAPLNTTNTDMGGTGMPSDPPAFSTASDSLTNAAATLANVHASGQAEVRFRNPSGGNFATITAPIILVMGADTTSAIDEDNINTSGLSNLLSSGAASGNNSARVDMVGDSATDTPAVAHTATTANWTGATALETFDATVVGGELQHDQTNYSTGYIPVGPNLTTQSAGAQYVTFMFRANPLSKFDVELTTGGIAGIWIKLPGVSDDNTTNNYWDGASGDNGWWSLSSSYGGVGVPGTGAGGNGSANAAVAGNVPLNSNISGSRYTATFGPESAANATNNVVLVRIRLDSGQSVTDLRFREASN